ncbi:MAG: energy-coupling factor transporter ATPase [Lachnospiraceae bacterium]|nr:energy-coupling factor transporter ATPase [Lachnospiraceae bacterium]
MQIIIDQLNYSYGDGAMRQQALKDVSFSIPKGQFLALIGHTGSGKSTLIQHLNGLLKAESGSIYFHGEDISDEDYNRKKLRSKVGLVFQYPEHQLFETDVFRDVCFGPKNLGLDDNKAGLKAFEALHQVGIPEELFYVSPFELSGGQKRRVAIAGVLAMEPEVLILDEPTAGLDPRGREELLTMLKKLHKQKHMTILLVSHSMEDVAKYAERVLVMEKGSVIHDGSPKEVFSKREELKRLGLDVPEITDFMQDLQREGFPVNPQMITVEEARQEILKAFKKGQLC